MNLKNYLAPTDGKLSLSDFDCYDTGDIKDKKETRKELKKNKKKMAELQDMFYAHDKYSLLIIFQAMDAAGKDSAIKHVMSGVNPQGTQVFSFKQPSNEELDHDYLWRTTKALPERGRIGIFNRSYYEEVLIVKLHNLIKYQKIPAEFITDNIWDERYEQIRNFEEHIYKNGTAIIKFFLHVSKDEQKKRFLERLENPAKNWKFSAGDLKEREYWDEYMKCYEDAISKTSKPYAPWYIVPADHKWYTRLVISEVIIKTLTELKMSYPGLTIEQKQDLENHKEFLKKE